jgi:outer membrane protein insertion porin family
MNTGFYLEREEEFNQDFGTRITGANVGFTRKFLKFITTTVNVRFEQRDQFGADGDAWTEPRIITVVTPAVSIDRRDSFIRPKKGYFSSMSLDFSRGIDHSFDDYIKYRLDGRVYHTPFNRLTFALVGRFGHIEAYGAYNDVPDDQLFFLGGISNVRGVDENMLFFDENDDPIGGRTSLFGSIEARIDLGRNVELPLFFDIGKLSGTPGEGITEDFRSTVGFGLRYITPIGPAGFLYGINLDRKDGEPPGRLHFSIGYTF